LDGCSHIYCYKCIINWAERTNTCPTCKAKFIKVTRNKTGKIKEVEEREQGTHYTIEDAENDYGDSASEESEYGAAHPFIDEEAESGEETSEDEVEAQKECNRWAGYLNCEDERFEKKNSSEEEDEALADEDFANMDRDSYDYDDFVVPDDDVSMLTDASSDSSERGRVKRRRLKRTRRSSSSSSSEIHISIEEEESIDEDQPRRKRRRIDDDDGAEERHHVMKDVKNESKSPPLYIIDEPPTMAETLADAHLQVVRADEAERKPIDQPIPSAEVAGPSEIRTKKRKRSKRKESTNIASSGSVPASQSTPASVRSEIAVKQEDTKSQQDNVPVVHERPREVKTEGLVNSQIAAEENKKKKKKKNKQRIPVSESQSTDGAANGQIVPPSHSPSIPSAVVVDVNHAAIHKKKNRKKKNKNKHHNTQSQGTTVAVSSQVSQPLPTSTPSSIVVNGDATQATVHKKKRKKKNKQNINLSQNTNGGSQLVSSQVSQLLPSPSTPSVVRDANQAAVHKQKNRKKKKKGTQNGPNTVVNLTHVITVNGVQQVASSNPNVLSQTIHAGSTHKKDNGSQTNGAADSAHVPQAVHHRPKPNLGGGDRNESKANKKSKKKRKSSDSTAVNGDRSEVRLSSEERKGAEEMYLHLKKLIGRM
jgi:hypothetical protein